MHLHFFCIDWPMLGLRLRDASATEISDPSSKSACSQQQKCLRKQPWGHTSHNMKLATNNVAHFNFGSPLQTFAPISPMSSYQPATMTTCAATPRWASASSPPHAAASAPLSRWALDGSWCFTIHIEEDTIYIYIYMIHMIIHLYTMFSCSICMYNIQISRFPCI